MNQIRLGNGVRSTDYTYDEERRWLEGLKSANSYGQTLQSLEYTFELSTIRVSGRLQGVRLCIELFPIAISLKNSGSLFIQPETERNWTHA